MKEFKTRNSSIDKMSFSMAKKNKKPVKMTVLLEGLKNRISSTINTNNLIH